MNLPVYYYLIAAGAVVLAAIVAVARFRSRRPRPRRHSPYVEALKLLVDGRDDGAFARLQEAVKLGTAPTDAYIKLGNLLRARGEVTKALQIHQSLTVKSDLSKEEKKELYLSLADDHASLGDSGRAVRVLENAVRELSIRSRLVFQTLAKHYHVLGQYEKAYEALKEAKKLDAVTDRELALYLTSAAEAMLAKGQRKEARRELQRALKHDSKCAPCLLVLGNLAEQAGDLDGAIDSWKRVALASPQLSATALHKLESTLFERGRFGDIERIYSEVRTNRPGDEAANLGLAGFYKKQGRGEEAISLLEDYVTVHSDSMAAALLLTSFYARYRDSETLERYLDESFREPWRADTFECRSCHLRSDVMRWHCPRCNAFDSFSTNDHEIL